MSINVELYGAVWTQKMIKLPEVCPHCGADFREDEMLVQESYMATQQTCKIDETDRINFDETFIKDFYESNMITGYACAACEGQIVEGGEETQCE